jgi:hypothetical protein
MHEVQTCNCSTWCTAMPLMHIFRIEDFFVLHIVLWYCVWCSYSGSPTSSFYILYDTHIQDRRLLRAIVLLHYYIRIHMFHSRDATDAKYIFRIDNTLIYDVLLIVWCTYSGTSTLSFMMYAYCMMHIFRIGDNLFYDVLYSIFMIILDAAHIQDRRHSLLWCIA